MYNWKVSRELKAEEYITKGDIVKEVQKANKDVYGTFSADCTLPQGWLNDATKVLHENQHHLDFPRFLQEKSLLDYNDIYDLVRLSFVCVYPDSKWIGYMTPITTIGKFLSLVLKDKTDSYGLDSDFFKIVPSDNELHFQIINRKYN
tara:strand:+ start:112 stop:552 length:441 start_codon:yes stop_codon:yes gene_type:complete